MKSPLAKARDKWINENLRSTDPTTLGAESSQRPYLQNRLEKAFCDGWNAAQLDFYSAADRSEPSIKQKTKKKG